VSDPLTIVRNQLQTALEKIAWIERARSKTLPDDHFLSVDMTVETVRYLSNLVNSFSDDPEFDELVAEQHINRVLARNVLEAQAERDAYKRALEWYALESVYFRPLGEYGWGMRTPISEDKGRRARAALAGSSDAGGAP
jgi:hypothetical protein